MDRLIMESVLSDVSSFNLTKDGRDGFTGVLVMGFTEDRIAQVNHAFSELKKMVQEAGVALLICRTMVDGIYDLEICTDVLDEPLRINNKAIPNDMILEMERHVGNNPKIMLGADGLSAENWLAIGKLNIKNCEG